MARIEPDAVVGAPDEYATAIGHLVVAWASCELELHSYLRALLGLTDKPLSRAFTSQIQSARRLIEMLESVGKQLFSGQDLDTFLWLVRMIEYGRTQRNRYDHSLWLDPTEERDVPHTVWHKQGRTEPEVEPVDLEDLQSLPGRLGIVQFRLLTFLQDRGFTVLTP